MPNWPDSYFAGLFDGEGCVAAYIHTDRSGHAAHRISFEVRMTNKVPILALKEAYGGRTYLNRQDVQHPDRLRFHSWVLHGPAIIPVASRWLPFLLVKTKQVELAAEMARTFQVQYTRWSPLPKEVQTIRAQLVSEIRGANHAQG